MKREDFAGTVIAYSNLEEFTDISTRLLAMRCKWFSTIWKDQPEVIKCKAIRVYKDYDLLISEDMHISSFKQMSYRDFMQKTNELQRPQAIKPQLIEIDTSTQAILDSLDNLIDYDTK